MPNPQTPVHRSHTTPDTPKSRYHEPPGSSIELREEVEGEDGVFEIRMPIATTGEVRNENDDPLTRDELSGMAQQIGDGVVSVFPDHGKTAIGGPQRYSIGEKGGEWEGAEVVSAQDSESGEDELIATARLMDPDTLPDIPVRGMLGAIKELTKRDMSLPSSIGWKSDDDSPGGNDLMEASIVGISADPRTVSSGGEALVARAAVEAGADPNALVESVREAVESERPLGPPEDPDRFESFEECVQALAEDGDLSEEEAERVCGAWENAQAQSTSNDMTTESDPDESSGTDGEEQNTNQSDEEEFREFMREQQEQQTEILQALADAIREDDDDDDDEEEDDEENEADEDEEEDDEDEDGEQASESPDGEQDASDEFLLDRINELESELQEVREGERDVEDPAGTPESEQDTDGEEESEPRPARETWGRTTN